MIDALGNRTDYVLDARGRRAAVMDADGHTTHFEYDVAGRRTATVFPDDTPGDDTDNPRVTTAYDPVGRKVAETDEVGQTMRYVYDAAGQLVEVIEPDPDTGQTPLPSESGGVRTTYGYDEQGNKTTQTDALGRITTWSYDQLGRPIARTLPLGQTEIYAYDAVGNPVSQTDFNGETTMYAYDVMNRQVSLQAPDRVVTTTYTVNGLRKSVMVAAGSDGLEPGTTTWTYGARDRTTRVDHPDGTWIEYTYDEAGNRTELITPNGTTGYSFDELNRISTVTAPGGGVTGYTYSPAGDRISVLHPNGTEQIDSFDARHRLTSRVNLAADGSILSEHHYALSDDNRQLSLSEDGGRQTTWTYDARDRLNQEHVTDPTRGDRTTSFIYDLVGNRLERTTICTLACGGELPAGTTTYTYDDNDRLTSETGPAGTTTYEYDDNGSLIEENAPSGLTTYGYNTARRLTQAQTPNDSLRFEYDSDGIRRARTQNGQTTNFLADTNRPYAQVIEEADSAGAIQASYVHAHDLLSQNRAGVERYFHADGLGSTRALSDATGSLSDQYGYSAYGESAYESGSTDNAYRYTGEQLEAGLEQYYLRARYYRPGSGRFSRMDEFLGLSEMPITLNKYVYANLNPVTTIDPSGNLGVASFGGLSSGLNIQGVLATAALGSAGIYTVIQTGRIINKRTGERGFGIWDAVAIPYFRVQAENEAEASDAARDEINRSPERHHTIPTYLCGANSQQLSKVRHDQHVLIHTEIAGIQLALKGAEEYATRAIGRRRSPEVLRIAQTEEGRASIANALNSVYSYGGWRAIGTPSIGVAFDSERSDYVSGRKTSLPFCTRVTSNGG